MNDGRIKFRETSIKSIEVGVRLTFDLVPGVPLGLALWVEQTRPGGGIVADSSLLVEAVQLEQLRVTWARFQVLHLFSSLLKCFLLNEKRNTPAMRLD